MYQAWRVTLCKRVEALGQNLGRELTGRSVLPRISSKERLATAMAKETEAWIDKGLRNLFDRVSEPGEQLQAAVRGIPSRWHSIPRRLMPSWAISFERCAFVTDRNIYLCRLGGVIGTPITVIVKYPAGKHNLEVRGRRLVDRGRGFLIIPVIDRGKRGFVQAIAIPNSRSRDGGPSTEQPENRLCLQ
jgi:hypothetical protein